MKIQILYIMMIVFVNASPSVSATAFSDFLLRFNRVSELASTDIDTITSNILSKFTSCDSNTIDCENCLKSAKFEASGVFTTTVNENEFRNVSIIIFCYLVELETFCKENSTIDLSQCLNAITNSTEELTHEQLEEYTEEHLKPNYNPNTQSNYSQGYESVECIDGHELVEKYSTNDESVIGIDLIGTMLADIVSSLYNDAPIGCESPYKNWFIENLFSKYSSTSENMNINDLQNLMSLMGLDADSHADGSHEHEHRRRRSTVHDYNKCYDADTILDIYGLGSTSIKPTDLEKLLPSLLYMNLTSVCVTEETTESSNTIAERYGYGTIAVFIVTLLSILGIVVLPCFKSSIYQQILTALSALAASTLFCDATLHLIPAVLGAHSESSHAGGHASGHAVGEVSDYTQKMLVLIASLYAFWLLEILFAKLTGLGHSHGGFDDDHHNHGKNKIAVKPISEFETPTKSPIIGVENPKEGILSSFKNIKPIAWMILFGDGVHNFADGLAIGASFAVSTRLGISTTIAVVVHEIPHELGDYAVLIRSGFSHFKALLFNFISALTCFIGFYIGVSIATNEDVSLWIFATTSGFFYYISLVDLFPDLLINQHGRWTWLHFLVVNLALWLGFAIMFLLAVFEEQISI